MVDLVPGVCPVEIEDSMLKLNMTLYIKPAAAELLFRFWFEFLAAIGALYVQMSVRRSVGWSVGRSVCP